MAECPGPAQGSISCHLCVHISPCWLVTRSLRQPGPAELLLLRHGCVVPPQHTRPLPGPISFFKTLNTAVQNSLWALGSPRAHEEYRLLDPQAHGVHLRVARTSSMFHRNSISQFGCKASSGDPRCPGWILPCFHKGWQNTEAASSSQPSAVQCALGGSTQTRDSASRCRPVHCCLFQRK